MRISALISRGCGVVLLITAGMLAGCENLNSWSGPGYRQDPFMSVADYAPPSPAPRKIETAQPILDAVEIPTEPVVTPQAN